MFGVDAEIVHLAALLHDYASVKNEAYYENHHVHSPILAEKILQGLGVSQAKINAVKKAITGHRGSVGMKDRTPEAACLASADALTHIENVPALLHLAYQEHDMGIDEGAVWIRSKLQRNWAKMHPEVQALSLENYLAAQRVPFNGTHLK
jgi:uncharacterized protein